MTDPTPGSRWSAVRSRLAGLFERPGRFRLTLLGWACVALGVAVVLGVVVWVNALTTPVHRAGRPTTSVTPIPAPTTATPIPTPSADGTPTATGSGSAEPTSTNWPKVPSSGKFATAGVDVAATGSAGRLHRYSVRVETSARLNADKVGRQVADVLNDPRSWAGSGSVRFALVADPSKADVTITLAAPGTAAKLCRTDGGGSCVASGDAVINASWWRGTAPTYDSRTAWQAYLVNHAVGQLLGESSEDCAKKGRPAPVTMPQSTELGGCTSNAWPFP